MSINDQGVLPCSITGPLEVFGDRWTLLIVKSAFGGLGRFSQFEDALAMSKSRLQDRLKRLLDHGILVKQPSPHGKYDEYRLTQKGHDIYPILMAFKDWGDTYMAPDGPPVRYRHAHCGGEAHARLTCSACGDEMTARDTAAEAGPGMTARQGENAGAEV